MFSLHVQYSSLKCLCQAFFRADNVCFSTAVTVLNAGETYIESIPEYCTIKKWQDTNGGKISSHAIVFIYRTQYYSRSLPDLLVGKLFNMGIISFLLRNSFLDGHN